MNIFAENELKYPNFSFVRSDINDLEFLYDCDYIINTAAETHVGNSISNSDDFISSNVNGVHNLLELIRNYRQESTKVPVLLHFSTDEVYGESKTDIPFTEAEGVLRPTNPYSASKAAAEMIVRSYIESFGMKNNIRTKTAKHVCVCIL